MILPDPQCHRRPFSDTMLIVDLILSQHWRRIKKFDPFVNRLTSSSNAAGQLLEVAERVGKDGPPRGDRMIVIFNRHDSLQLGLHVAGV